MIAINPTWRGKNMMQKMEGGERCMALADTNSLAYVPVTVEENTKYKIIVEAKKESGNGIVYFNIYGNKNYDFPQTKIIFDKTEWGTYDAEVCTGSFPKVLPLVFRIFREPNGFGTVLIRKILIEFENKIDIIMRPPTNIGLESLKLPNLEINKFSHMPKSMPTAITSRMNQRGDPGPALEAIMSLELSKNIIPTKPFEYNPDELYFCTYFDSNYLYKGLVCYNTLVNMNKKAKLFVICLDEGVFQVISKLENIIPIKLSEIENYCKNLLSVKKKRQPKEYYATMSPILPLYIFDNFKIDTLIYTDADMAFWSDPKEIFQIFGDKSIMVTDQEFEPPRGGIRFNVGILAYRNDKLCREFLEWWGQKCLEWCYWISTDDGKLADQGYLNILHPDYSRYNALSCPNPGINMGPWNLNKHRITEVGGKKMVDEKYNLVCYHYHEFKLTGANSYFATGWNLKENDKKIIYEPYFNLVKKV